MSNPIQTTLNGTFEAFDTFEGFATAFEPGHSEGHRAMPPVIASQQAKGNRNTLVSFLANTLGASRPDWRQARHARVNYASSRVRYVEEAMTQDQVREFE